MEREKWEVERGKFQWAKTKKKKSLMAPKFSNHIEKWMMYMVFKSVFIQKEDPNWGKNWGKVVFVFTFSKAWSPGFWPKVVDVTTCATIMKVTSHT